jgi:hypothetical protein
MGGAALVLDRRPLLAGALLGSLADKPQLVLLVPLMLAATGGGASWPLLGQWRLPSPHALGSYSAGRSSRRLALPADDAAGHP